MKISKLACAASAASATAILLAPSLGFTKGRVSVGANPSAAAKIDLEVVVPRVIALKIGSGGSTIDKVTFSGLDINVGGAALSGDNNLWDGTTDPELEAEDGDSTVAVKIFSNAGDISLARSGADLTDAVSSETIPLSDISVVATNSDIEEPGATSSTASATNGVVNLTDTWTYTFTATSMYAAGTYETQLTYTATVL